MRFTDFLLCIISFVLFLCGMGHCLVVDNSAREVFLFALPTILSAFGMGYGLAKHIMIKGKWDDK